MSHELNESEFKPAAVKPIRHLLDAIERSRKTSEPGGPSSTSLESMKAREERLSLAQAKLKDEFAGLDAEIDRLIQVIRPWFILPQAQRRPLVVSLWGMTGVGKTSLIRRLSQLLDFNKSYEEFDLGQFSGDSLSGGSIVSPRLWRASGQPSLIFFDEIHAVRTVDSGMEVDRPQLRELWTLMDSGIVPFNVDSHRGLLLHLRSNLKMLHQMPEVQQTHLTDGHLMDQIIAYLGLNIEPEELSQLADQNKVEAYQWFVDELQWVLNSAKSFDFRQALVFIAGNLDELFKMHAAVNPDDLNADDLFEKTKQIGVDQLREALLARFRPEQVGRLGSIQFIFPSLSPASFRKIIRAQLVEIGKWMQASFSSNIVFDDSVVELIFREGVIPTQGARPVLSTLKELIESRIADWLIEALQGNVRELKVSYDVEAQLLTATGKGESGSVVKVANRIQTREEKLPEITMSEEFKNLLAVHEAGHAVVGITSQGILPIKTLVGPLSWHRGGPRVVFPTTEFQTKAHLLSVIETLLAGLVAEELVFGKGHTSLGVERDVHHATVLAAQMITMNAMGDHIGCSVPAVDQPLNIHALRKDDDQLKEQWLAEAKDRAAETLKRQWPLFTAITQSLLTNERLTAKDMKDLVTRHYLGSKEEVAQITEGSVPSTFKNHSTVAFKKALLRKPTRIKKAS